MWRPIQTYLKNLFVSKRILGNSALGDTVRADKILTELIDEQKIPGLSITVLKDAKTLFQKGYGYANLENDKLVNPEKTIFRIASVSKPIAATALAQMVADGVIELDASFYEYVPYYPKKKWDFTIRQLASHTAGVRGYRGGEYGSNKPYSIKESLEIFSLDDLLFEPGTDYFYNSYGWVLISLAMQEVSGIPFENYVHRTVLKPLEMDNTFAPRFVEYTGFEANSKSPTKFSTPPELTTRITSFYTRNRSGFRKAVPVNNFYKLAGGGYLSTSADIAKLGQAYLDNRVLNESVLEQFLTSVSINGKSTYYGLGWQVSEDKRGRPYYGHIGNGIGVYSNFFVYPNEKMVFAILINCTNPNVQQQLDEVVDALISVDEKI